MLKRKFDETVDDSKGPETASSSNRQFADSDNSICGNQTGDTIHSPVVSGPPPTKRMRKKVNFKGVSVFYFPRKQGFTCVPSEGGSTLGMSEKHAYTKDFSLSDYSKEQKRIHRAVLAEQRRQGKMFPSPLLASNLPPLTNDEDVSSASDSDSEWDDYYFLQPLPIRQRRVLLRTAGIKKIDNEEKDECRDIRVSRNVCGCDCKVFCDPKTCSCCLAGIQCQVDRLSFPCGCTKDGCCNPAGRIEFNPMRVRTHFIHTLMRLELERSDSHKGSHGSFSERSTDNEIDVVGCQGKDVAGAGNSESDDSGPTNDVGGSKGVKILKSKLKTNQTEVIDLNMFNSNEKGSCRDCQNTDMCNVMMHDLKFTMVNHQQQRAIATSMGAQPGYSGPEPHHLGLSPGLSLLHPPLATHHHQPPSQHMLLFNDGEEDIYHSENTSSVYFDNHDSSYSEMSDTSSDISDSRPFGHISQTSFSGKLQGSPSLRFPSSISSIGGHVHCQKISEQRPLNSNCIQTLQVDGRCGVNPPPTSSVTPSPTSWVTPSSTTSVTPSPTSSGTVEQQLLTQTPQLPPAGMTSQSLIRPPFQPGVGPPDVLTQTQGLHTSNNHLTHSHVNSSLTHSHMDSSLELVTCQHDLMLQGAESVYESRFPDSTETPNHASGPPPSCKQDSPMQANKTFSVKTSPVTGTNYFNQSGHTTFSVTTTANLGSPISSAVGASSFQLLQTAQHTSCWSSTLASPTLRECLGLGSLLPETGSSLHDQRAGPLEISCSSVYQQESESCTVTPASPNSPTVTYATMTATTRDQIAAHCPGISSHMDGRSEPPTSTVSGSGSTFSSYQMTSPDSGASSCLGTSRNLLYDTPYPHTSDMKSCNNFNVTCTGAEKNQQFTSCVMSNYSKSHIPSSSSNPPLTLPSSLTSEATNTCNLHSAEVPPTELPARSSTAGSETANTLTFLNQLTAPAQGPGSFVFACGSFNNPHSAEAEIPNASFVSEKVNSVTHSVKGGVSSATHSVRKGVSSVTHAVKEGVSLVTHVICSEKDQEGINSLNHVCTSHLKQLVCEETNGVVKSDLNFWNSECNKEEVNSWKAESQHQANVTSASLSSQIPEVDYEQDRNYELCPTDSEVVSSLSSSTVHSTASSSTSSSSSSPTSEEEKEQAVTQDFGEIIKESLVEMVLV